MPLTDIQLSCFMDADQAYPLSANIRREFIMGKIYLTQKIVLITDCLEQEEKTLLANRFGDVEFKKKQS